ncbi:MAG: cell division protein CrgA [Bifidobacteriaceae bacterium]|jgi:cobalamin biosynthesis Mg chelatase CobN|nr:cell division protein CrgA [Bifidobacteriaceae bacterium]MCI1979028.1 cell division protein CrgA [Bifidobacteriaceae bacterium]
MAHNDDANAVEKTANDELENTAVASEASASSTVEATSDQATSAASDTTDAADEGRDPEELSLEEVQNVLNKSADSRDLPKNVQRLLAREQESSKRVEESIKGAKTNPRWFVPVFVLLLVIGLAWVVVTYVTDSNWPIPNIHNWNLLIGFAIMMVGFLMTMWWN